MEAEPLGSIIASFSLEVTGKLPKSGQKCPPSIAPRPRSIPPTNRNGGKLNDRSSIRFPKSVIQPISSETSSSPISLSSNNRGAIK